MSYLAFGGGNGGGPASMVGVALAATGVSMPVANSIWMVASCIIIGGVLLTFAKLGPRLALDPIKMPGSGKHRPWLTLNGRPMGRRFRR